MIVHLNEMRVVGVSDKRKKKTLYVWKENENKELTKKKQVNEGEERRDGDRSCTLMK